MLAALQIREGRCVPYAVSFARANAGRSKPRPYKSFAARSGGGNQKQTGSHYRYNCE
jgi:hypothetical protein